MLKKGLGASYNCWLNYKNIDLKYIEILKNINYTQKDVIIESIVKEIGFVLEALGEPSAANENITHEKGICLINVNGIVDEAFDVNISSDKIIVSASGSRGHLYGVFHLLRKLCIGDVSSFSGCPSKKIRMLNHWDNLSGSIERGYAGKSIFFDKNEINEDTDRVTDYARLLASIGINAVCINNVNADYEATMLMKDKIGIVKAYADIFKRYGIKTFISANFAAPVTLGELDTADPLSEEVQKWWDTACGFIYNQIKDFGGFVVKADSEGRPGPFTYGRTHADGANMLARAINQYGGKIIWRCFVYNCQQDWRDRKTDRARAAYDNFIGIDGDFDDNVYLQVKNGPMDFQIREPVTPMFGAMNNTRILLEFQITQEYTGQQKHICYLVPMWKEVIDFDTYANGKGTTVDKTIEGLAAVANVGNDLNWTGHVLAQANLYGYGRLCWDTSLSAKEITDEWIFQTFGKDVFVKTILDEILLGSRQVYENYNAPLGIGWMVNVQHHYGVCVDGYEYSRWGTYHRSNNKGMGMDRTIETGTGFSGQYFEPNRSVYNNINTCPDELLLFFHHVPYNHVLKSGKTVIQHIYDTHFEGYDQAVAYKGKLKQLKGKIDDDIYKNIIERIEEQIESAKEWRDQINTYYYRMTGINDEQGRKIYE